MMNLFEIGKAKVVRSSAKDTILLIGAGVTPLWSSQCTFWLKPTMYLLELLIHWIIQFEWILFTIKPLDQATILENARVVGGKVVTVYEFSMRTQKAALARMFLVHFLISPILSSKISLDQQSFTLFVMGHNLWHLCQVYRRRRFFEAELKLSVFA